MTRKLRRSLLPNDVTSLSCLRWRFGPDQGEVAGTGFHTLILSYLFTSTCIHLLKSVYVSSRACLKIQPLVAHSVTLFSAPSAVLMADAGQLWWWCDACHTASLWPAVAFIFVSSPLLSFLCHTRGYTMILMLKRYCYTACQRTDYHPEMSICWPCLKT